MIRLGNLVPITVLLALALGTSACGDTKRDIPPPATSKCGNGKVDRGETCDSRIATSSVGACPTVCDDGVACTENRRLGDANACNVQCDFQPVSACLANDGCCPAGCNAAMDNDCSTTCDNGTVDEGETCDQNCPAGCDDLNACTQDTPYGASTTCSFACGYQVELDCVAGDGCCPVACGADVDSDCSSTCGNGTVEAPLETCDGNCPASCADVDSCTRDLQIGSVDNCNLSCLHPRVTSCEAGDGCCAPGCTNTSDSDCPASCETVTQCRNNDTCCPNACTNANDNDCPFSCTNVTVCVSGDTCCPEGCTNANDTDCVAASGAIGDPCTTAAECDAPPDAAAVCNVDGWTGGYCTFFCTSALCPSGSFCDTMLFQCIKECTPASPIECRSPGYTCAQERLDLMENLHNGCLPALP